MQIYSSSSTCSILVLLKRRVWRYQRGNQSM